MRLGLRAPALAAAVEAALDQWLAEDGSARLFQRDAALWTSSDEARWLGWLDPSESAAGLPQWLDLARDARAEGFTHALVLGMGGSSLFPLVLARMFGAQAGWPILRVLDSTDPTEVLAAERSVDLASCLVLVASKSGSTLEPTLFMERLLGSVARAVGESEAPRRFVAITDPGSQLEAFARERGFRAVVPGLPSIGGRFSALSPFGLLPGAVSGAPVSDILDSAREMAQACRPSAADIRANPGVMLGCALGSLALKGHDKLTLVPSRGLVAIGAWIEQLVAESTGKRGQGIVPIDGERLAAPSAYGRDRVFVGMTLSGEEDAATTLALDALEEAGHPVLRLEAARPADLGALAYQWELATAVAGSVLGLHPFDQPDVEAAKVAARELMLAFESSGEVPREPVLVTDGPLRVEADERNARALGTTPSVEAALGAHLARLTPGDYFAILAFVPETPGSVAALQRMRHAVREAWRVATSVGFGPRFLHSTGQLHAGGASSGVFLQITCDDPEDCSIPGRSHGFSMVKAAQAGGNLRVLGARGRRALRVHVTGSLNDGLAALAALVEGRAKDVG